MSFQMVNASNIEKDWDWISSQNDLEEMKNVSDEYSLLAIQIQMLQKQCKFNRCGP